MILVHSFFTRTGAHAANHVRINGLQPLMHLSDSPFRAAIRNYLVVEVRIEATFRPVDFVCHTHRLLKLLLALSLSYVELVQLDLKPG